MLGDLYFKMENNRKETGIPGSSTSVVAPLYSKQDLTQALFQSKVKSFRKWYFRPQAYSHSFRTNNRPSSSQWGPKGWGKAGRGKGGKAWTGWARGGHGGQIAPGYGSQKGRGRGMAPSVSQANAHDASLSQGERKEAMVGAECPTKGPTTDRDRCDGRTPTACRIIKKGFSKISSTNFCWRGKYYPNI